MRFPVSSPKLYILTRDRVSSCKLACLGVIDVHAAFLLVMSALTMEASEVSLRAIQTGRVQNLVFNYSA